MYNLVYVQFLNNNKIIILLYYRYLNINMKYNLKYEYLAIQIFKDHPRVKRLYKNKIILLYTQKTDHGGKK